MAGTALLDRAEAFAGRHDKALSALAVAWFVVSAADAARFIDLPEPPLFGTAFWIFFGVLWNAGWWGFARPALIRRREERRGEPPVSDG